MGSRGEMQLQVASFEFKVSSDSHSQLSTFNVITHAVLTVKSRDRDGRSYNMRVWVM